MTVGVEDRSLGIFELPGAPGVDVRPLGVLEGPGPLELDGCEPDCGGLDGLADEYALVDVGRKTDPSLVVHQRARLGWSTSVDSDMRRTRNVALVVVERGRAH
jgi:hypothetical protein